MAFAADETHWSAQSNARSGHAIDVFVVHHQAATDDDATVGLMVGGGRQVSATWTVDNAPPVGAMARGWARITAVVPEDRRPWTSASVVDDRALTVECANSSGDPYWGIDPTSFEAVARLIAYGHLAYGIPLQRATRADPRGVVGHRDVAAIYGGSYATACPGNLDIDALIARAQQLVGDPAAPFGGALSQEDDDMTPEQDSLLREANTNAYEARRLAGDAKAQTDPTRLNAAVSYVLTLLGVPQGVAELLGRPAAGAVADPKTVAAEFAALVGDDLAQDVIDALAARLAGSAA